MQSFEDHEDQYRRRSII